MEKKDFIKQFLAGLFFILSLVMIGGVIFTIGVEKGFTEPRFNMTVYFRKVGGLAAGSPVTLSGVNVGTVANIDFLDKEVKGRGVRVTLSLFKKYRKQLHKSTYFAIITHGLLGEKIVEITTHPDFYRVDLKEPVIGGDPLDVQNLAETFGDTAEALLKTSKTLNTTTRQLQQVISSTRRLLNRVEQRIIDGNLFKVF